MKLKDKAALKVWDAFKKSIEKATVINIDETAQERDDRIELLKENIVEFCKYYFPHYCESEFSKHQKAFLKKVQHTRKLTISRAWHRSGAKSTLVMMACLYRKFIGLQKNTLLASKSSDNAIELLRPFMAELESNQRIINDYGVQKGLSQWESGKFVTSDNCSFRAVGSGQSPRGSKNNEVRPDCIICDDLDDEEVCRNQKRLDLAWDWTMGALYGCFDIKKGGLFIVVNNIIAKDSVMTRMKEKHASDSHEIINVIERTGNIDQVAIAALEKELKATQKAFERITSKNPEYEAFEKKLLALPQAIGWLRAGYEVTWKERFSMYDVAYLFVTQGERLFEREYMNNPLTEGKVFKGEWMQFKKLPPLNSYAFLVAYLDPSFKGTKTSDTKCWVLVGLYEGKYHIRKVYCDRATTNEMVSWGYAINDLVKSKSASVQFWMEEVFLQDLLYKDFAAERKVYGYPLPLRGDKRKKPDKDSRITATSGYFERGDVYFDETIKEDHHTKKLIDQYLLFEPGSSSKKDGPDAVEGAIYILGQMVSSHMPIKIGIRSGNKYKL